MNKINKGGHFSVPKRGHFSVPIDTLELPQNKKNTKEDDE